MNKETITLIVRLIVNIVTGINLLASAFGFAPLDLDENTIYLVVSAIAMVAAWIWGFWKNNNFTKAAQKAQGLLNNLKIEEKAKKAAGANDMDFE